MILSRFEYSLLPPFVAAVSSPTGLLPIPVRGGMCANGLLSAFVQTDLIHKGVPTGRKGGQYNLFCPDIVGHQCIVVPDIEDPVVDDRVGPERSRCSLGDFKAAYKVELFG